MNVQLKLDGIRLGQMATIRTVGFSLTRSTHPKYRRIHVRLRWGRNKHIRIYAFLTIHYGPDMTVY